jgi:hypothetical protein
MKEELITFETAKLAKEKGFDLNGHTNDEVSPTQSLLQKWLREVHKINVESNYLPNIPGYRCLFVPMTDKISMEEKYKLFSKYYGRNTHDSYEEALEEGLQEALKLIEL